MFGKPNQKMKLKPIDKNSMDGTQDEMKLDISQNLDQSSNLLKFDI
jgi:hypothetical protein